MPNGVISTIGVLILKNNAVLLVSHGKNSGHLDGKYGLPAGRVQVNESMEETACREAKEETGLDIVRDDLLLLPGEWLADIARKDGTKRFSLKVFLANKFGGQLNGNAETAPEWINIKDLEKYDLLPNVADIIAAGLKFLNVQE